LVFQVREHADEVAAVLLEKRGDWFRAGIFPASGVNRGEGYIRIDGPDCLLDHLTTLIYLGDNPISGVRTIGLDRYESPLRRW
jgi:hypothetical protein